MSFLSLFLFLFFLSPSVVCEYTPSDEEVSRISTLTGLALKGKYPGSNLTRRTRHGVVPIWSQRTAFLYYSRKNVGEPIIWLTLSMGVVGNAKDLVSNKRTWTHLWREYNPTAFLEMEEYIPRTWSDPGVFSGEMDEEGIYVYKPVYGYQGRGIIFHRGADMIARLEEDQGSDWVVQEFVESFLYHGRKTHIRVVSLIIVQPDGSREFFIYKRMRLYTAPESYEKDRLFDDEDASYMLLTNLHQNEAHFKMDPSNNGKQFSPQDCVFDTETALNDSDTGVSFDHVLAESKKMHSVIYSVIGDAIECKPTDISIYSDACFHLMASDVSFDRDGKPYLLEMNHRMGFSVLWSPEEQLEFSNGVASLVRDTASPYHVDDPPVWERLEA